MYLVVGLGNPGSTYAKTRHNAGFMLVDRLYEAYGRGAWMPKFNGSIARASVEGQEILLFKPETYMNRSGPAILRALQFYKIPLNRMIVVYDDLDLPVGSFKLRVQQDSLGGSGGHNGIKSFLQGIGSIGAPPSFLRIRIGIDHPKNIGFPIEVSDYVLGKFTQDQWTVMERLQEDMVRHFANLLGEDKNMFTQAVKGCSK